MEFTDADTGWEYAYGVLSIELSKAHDEIGRLRRPWQAVDAKDWEHLELLLGHSGHGQFWKEVLSEMRAALNGEQSENGRKE